MGNKAVLISCSDHYVHRMIYWDRSLQSMGYQTTYVTTDFLHVEKTTYRCPVEGCVQLHVMPYRKNLSVQRILSHRMFAQKVLRYLEEQNPDVVVSLLPPNFLAKYLGQYKKRHPQTKLIFDIFDLWPETFPSSKVKKILAPVFRVWANLRDRNLGTADFVTTECDLFRRRLALDPQSSQVIYFSLPPYEGVAEADPLPRDRAEIAYLGSINNIIDIPRIVAVLGALQRRLPTTLHIIGGGERSEEFQASAAAAGIDVRFYGKVFQEEEKHRILAGCHFGLNIMKDSVCIGLTMKSVDYLRHGLPLISNIAADTEELIASQGVGVHVRQIEVAADGIATRIRNGIEPMKTAVNELYHLRFSSQRNEACCRSVLEKVLSPED